jgi:hypothetical protein
METRAITSVNLLLFTPLDRFFLQSLDGQDSSHILFADVGKTFLGHKCCWSEFLTSNTTKESSLQFHHDFIASEKVLRARKKSKTKCTHTSTSAVVRILSLRSTLTNTRKIMPRVFSVESKKTKSQATQKRSLSKEKEGTVVGS